MVVIAHICSLVHTYMGHTSKFDMWLSIDSLFCFTSFKTFYKMVHCVKPEVTYVHHILLMLHIIKGHVCAYMCHMYIININHVARSNYTKQKKLWYWRISLKKVLPHCKYRLYCPDCIWAYKAITGACLY